jgi:DNA-binding transcriptional ArsR family regulator
MASDDLAPRAADLDPAVAAALAQLAAADRETPSLACSLARLSKRAELAMSTLRRALTALQDAGLVELRGLDGERPTAALTAAGRAFCAAVFGASAG